MIVNSEIGRLRQVILHRPNLSLDRLTPENCKHFLFDDVLWTQKAREEHILFESALKEHGVKVYLLHDLLKETLDHVAARQWLTERKTQSLYHETSLKTLLIDFLDTLDTRQLATYLIGGLTWEEMHVNPYGLVAHTLDPNDFVLPPLPNHLFTRDTSCWIGKGVSINPMHWPVRHGETLNIAAIYKFHPLFKKSKFNVWYDGSEESKNLPSIEGGDVLVISKDCVAIGLSERTTPKTVELLAQQLFKKGDKKKILGIEIPKDRASMHLDTVMTMANYDTFCIAFPCGEIRAWCIKPDKKKQGFLTEPVDNIFTFIAKELGEKKLKLITLGGDDFAQQREQWTDASNLLAIAPGVAIGYDRNVKTNKKLHKAGIDVIEIPGSELGRGRGGPRCMSCPLEREVLE